MTGESLRGIGTNKTGPLETRFASRLMQIALDKYSKGVLSKTHSSDLNLVCAVEPQVQSLQKWLKTYDFHGEFSQPRFIRNLDQIFQDVHPVMSLHNMPNQMAGNLAINFKIGGEVINIAGRNSSFEAFNSASDLAHKNKKSLLVGHSVIGLH